MSVTLKNLVLVVTGGFLTTLAAQANACDRGGYRPLFRPAVSYQCQTYQRPVIQIQPQQAQPWVPPGINVTVQGQQQVGTASVSAVNALGGTAEVQQQSLGLTQQNAGLAQMNNMQQAQLNGAAPQGSGGFVQTGSSGTQQNASFNQPTGNVAPQGGNVAPQGGNTAPSNAAVGAAPTSPSQSAEKSAQTLALEALIGGSGSGQASAPQAQSPQTSSPTGNFTAQVSGGATVRLSLNQDGTFAWSAAKDGKTSNFQGNYSLNGSSLTLLRSDKQKLEGTLTPKAGGFNLRLAGQQGGELSFAGG